MVSSSIPDPPGFYRLCIVVPLGGCRVGFSPELVAWWARGPAPSCSRIASLSFSTLCLRISQFYFSAGYLSANGCRIRSTRRFLRWT
ncbi:hypothetical protein Hanom_Chr01g00009411 [Helianthus anomalus]